MIFLTPSPLGALPPGEVASTGPEIVDSQGRAVWFLPLPADQVSSDLRVQTYMGKTVLTWGQGTGFQVTVPGSTTDYICDTSYNVIASFQAGNGYNADLHEFLVTPQNTALITVYANVPMDLSSMGGPANGTVVEGIVQEIDIATGAVVFEWHSLDHVPLSDSYVGAPSSGAYDYFHINSVNLDTDGNLLVSSRHTWTVYKVNRTTGAVIWRLGGKSSDFTLGPGLPFAWQHNAVAVDSQTIRIFDNESDGVPVLPASRVIWVQHDDTTMTATLVRSIQHPDGLSVPAEGDGQALSNGDTFVGWGILGRYSEFDPNGNLIYDASLPPGYNDYRSYRFPWAATPTGSPSVLAQANGDGTTAVHAVWNGATQVATWTILGGSAPGALSEVGTMAWNGLDTSTTVQDLYSYVEVVATDASGAAVGTSQAQGVAPAFATQPASQTIAPGTTVVFSATLAGGSAAYQWYLNGAALSDGPSGSATVSGSAAGTLVVTAAGTANAGSYACVLTSATGATTSAPAVLTVLDTTDVGRLTNVSARAMVGTGSNVLIAGFVVGGQQASGAQDLLIRASGPALQAFGITDALADPELQLTFVGSPAPATRLVTNWNGNATIAQTAAAVGAFPWTNPASLDSAFVHEFHMGSHTVEVLGASGDTGVALAEVYDATPQGSYTSSIPHLTNVSARARVGTGANILIAGFVVGGSTSKTVLIRASGPALSPFGVAGALPDPQIQIFSGASPSPIASNSGWNGNPAIAAAAASVGAFPWQDPSSHDSAVLVTLPPGAYTAQVQGQGADSGVALVEVYEVQ
jgi:plastocyanin